MTNKTEQLDLDRLEALARAATPGPWKKDSSYTIGPVSDEDDQSYGFVIPLADVYGDNRTPDAAFIAAANPAAVLALIALARRAQPEGEAPQADYEDHYLGIEQALEMNENMRKYGTIDKPAAQHADSGAQAADHVRQKFEAWAEDVGYPTRRGFGNANDYDFVQTRRMWESWQAALAAQSQGAQAAQLSIGFANNDQGVHVSVMQQHGDGSATVLHHGRVPAGDSFARFALAAKAEAPAPEWGRVRTVGDMVRNLLTLDQADPIHAAFPIEFQGTRRMRTSPITISRERVIDGKWVDQTRKDVPYATVVWAKPDERAQQAAAPGALEVEVRALAEKWHKDAVDTGFATSEAAVELLEVLDAAPSAPGTPEAPKGGVA